jgi:hypothetical protein
MKFHSHGTSFSKTRYKEQHLYVNIAEGGGCQLGRHFTTGATPPAFVALVILETGSHFFRSSQLGSQSSYSMLSAVAEINRHKLPCPALFL